MPADQLAVEHLDEDNYGVWSTHMEFLLTTKKCWRAVVATEELTSERDKETDQLARSYIGLTVKLQHLPTVKRCTTSKQAWNALKDIFAAKSFAQQRKLRRDFISLTKKAYETVTAFVARARALKAKLAETGYELTDTDLASQVLHGLPPDFNVVVTIIKTNKAANATFAVNDILPHLREAEQQVNLNSNRSNDTALAATFQHRRDNRQFNSNGFHRNLNRNNSPRGTSYHGNGPRGAAYRNNSPAMQQPSYNGPPRSFNSPHASMLKAPASTATSTATTPTSATRSGATWKHASPAKAPHANSTMLTAAAASSITASSTAPSPSLPTPTLLHSPTA